MIIILAQPEDVASLLAFRKEAAEWLSTLGTGQWSRPSPANRLAASTVFMVRDGNTTAATITLATEAEPGPWNDAEPAVYVNNLTVARSHAGQNLGGRLLNWTGDLAYRAGAKCLRLDDQRSLAALLPLPRS